jgi:hypothetical protein
MRASTRRAKGSVVADKLARLSVCYDSIAGFSTDLQEPHDGVGAGLSGQYPRAGFVLDRAKNWVPGDHARLSEWERTGLREALSLVVSTVINRAALRAHFLAGNLPSP